MYQEWMDGFPVLVPGCYYHNIEQLQKTKEYYIRHGDFQTAERTQKRIETEKYKLEEEQTKPNKFKQILNIMFS